MMEAGEKQLVTWEVVAHGRVQGVAYRAFTQAMAARLGVTGWVRNERDGTVRAVLQHPDRQVLSDLLSTMRRGTPAAVVGDLDVTPLTDSERYELFIIRPNEIYDLE